jgi:hypothetical protein
MYLSCAAGTYWLVKKIEDGASREVLVTRPEGQPREEGRY